MLKIIIASFLFFTGINHSLANSSEDILRRNKSDLTQIEKYLNGIKFLKSDFIQRTSNGALSKGKFFLSRPGKMRVEYGDPTPLLIIVNGSVLSYTDVELEETSYLTTNSTPASFLTRKNFSFFAKDVEIVDFEKSEDFTKVGIVKKNKKEAGIFRLIFSNNPLEFVMMEVNNDLGELTEVKFTNAKFGEEINDKLFITKNKLLP
ncbi:MAG: outer membrane lipoprotein-sorting protein [Rickettsiales bacterium]|jgi:outer membrane lipoprotein-sorting protein